jgi:hypothetical protein
MLNECSTGREVAEDRRPVVAVIGCGVRRTATDAAMCLHLASITPLYRRTLITAKARCFSVKLRSLTLFTLPKQISFDPKYNSNFKTV